MSDNVFPPLTQSRYLDETTPTLWSKETASWTLSLLRQNTHPLYSHYCYYCSITLPKSESLHLHLKLYQWDNAQYIKYVTSSCQVVNPPAPQVNGRSAAPVYFKTAEWTFSSIPLIRWDRTSTQATIPMVHKHHTLHCLKSHTDMRLLEKQRVLYPSVHSVTPPKQLQQWDVNTSILPEYMQVNVNWRGQL